MNSVRVVIMKKKNDKREKIFVPLMGWLSGDKFSKHGNTYTGAVDAVGISFNAFCYKLVVDKSEEENPLIKAESYDVITKLTPARILVGYVVAGVILSAVGLYKPLIDFAGAGATVPLTGFGHLLANGVKEAIGSDGMIGIMTGGLTASAGGIAASVFFGYVVSLIARPKIRD